MSGGILLVPLHDFVEGQRYFVCNVRLFRLFNYEVSYGVRSSSRQINRFLLM